MSAAIVTIITRSHLPFARVLMKSALRWAPQAKRFAILAEQSGASDPVSEDFEVIPSQGLPISDSRWFHFKYSAMELNMALKPHAVRYLLQRHGFSDIVYLDSDIRIYSSLDGLLKAMSSHSITLTPHLTSPLGDGRRPSDLDILRSGIYNGGFLAFHKCGETDAFLEWWKTRLQDHCLVDYANGLFVDQRWLDFVPAFYPGCQILREPGYNVAYWNLGERGIEQTPGGARQEYLVNGQPLRLFHFSGFNPEHPEIMSRHQNRHDIKAMNHSVQTLFLDYGNDLLQEGYKECKGAPYSYGSFANGTPIPDAARNVFYQAPALCRTIADPFSEEGYEKLTQYWQSRTGSEESPYLSDLGYSGRRSPVAVQQLLPKIAATIYDSRPDVQKAFPDPGGRDRIRFLAWMLTAGKAEHSVGPEFLDPVWREWNSALSELGPLQRLSYRVKRFAMDARSAGWLSRRS